MTGRIKAGQASGGFHPDLGKTKRAGFRFSADWPEGSIKRALISFFSKDNISLLFSHGKFPDAFVKYRKISLISEDSDFGEIIRSLPEILSFFKTSSINVLNASL